MTKEYVEAWLSPAWAIFAFTLFSAATGLPVVCGVRRDNGEFVIEMRIPLEGDE